MTTTYPSNKSWASTKRPVTTTGKKYDNLTYTLRRAAMKYGNLNKDLGQELLRIHKVKEHYYNLLEELDKAARSIKIEQEHNLDIYLRYYEQSKL